MWLKTLMWRWRRLRVTRTRYSGQCPAPSLLCCLSDWYKLYTIQISSLTKIWNGSGSHDNEAITVMWPLTNQHSGPLGHLLARTLLPCSRFDHTEKLVSVLLPFSGSLSSKTRLMLHCLLFPGSNPFSILQLFNIRRGSRHYYSNVFFLFETVSLHCNHQRIWKKERRSYKEGQ